MSGAAISNFYQRSWPRVNVQQRVSYFYTRKWKGHALVPRRDYANRYRRSRQVRLAEKNGRGPGFASVFRSRICSLNFLSFLILSLRYSLYHCLLAIFPSFVSRGFETIFTFKKRKYEVKSKIEFNF